MFAARRIAQKAQAPVQVGVPGPGRRVGAGPGRGASPAHGAAGVAATTLTGMPSAPLTKSPLVETASPEERAAAGKAAREKAPR